MWTYTEIANVVMNGHPVVTRGLQTTEIMNATISFTPGIFIHRKNINNRLAILESLMMIGGFFDIELIKEIAPNAKHDLYLKQSDYGPRIAEQWERCIEVLKNDPSSRRAVIHFNDRSQPSDDLACTSSIQFFIRGGSLFTTITMRSSDIVFGFPMDILMFGLLSQFTAAVLNVPCNKATINIGSFHIYHDTSNLATEKYEPTILEVNQRDFSWTVESVRDECFAAIKTLTEYRLYKQFVTESEIFFEKNVTENDGFDFNMGFLLLLGSVQ